MGQKGLLNAAQVAPFERYIQWCAEAGSSATET